MELLVRLRKETQASLEICRNALSKAAGNFEVAIQACNEELQKSRVEDGAPLDASLIFAQLFPRQGIRLLELASQSDFATRSENFQKLGISLLKESQTAGNDSVAGDKFEHQITPIARLLGERISVTDCRWIPLAEGSFLSIYAHQAPPLAGSKEFFCGSKISLVSTDCLISDPLSKRLAQHVLARRPTQIEGQDSGDSLLSQKFLFDEEKLVSQLLPQNCNILFFATKEAKFPLQLVENKLSPR